MPSSGGKRTSVASYTWGGWGAQSPGELAPRLSGSSPAKDRSSAASGDLSRFRDVFQPVHGVFSPNYPLVPTERERLRLWDFPVGYNTVYTPRSYETIGFGELRALAESHDITRLAIETRKDQIERL